MRRGQVEMVGLVFVVVIIVLGIVLYMQFSGSKTSAVPKDQQRTNSFLVALTETTVPACGDTFARVAKSCVVGDAICQQPCETLSRTMADIAAQALPGAKYSLRLESGDGRQVYAHAEDHCTADAASIIAAPQQPIPFGGGENVYLTLTLCR